MFTVSLNEGCLGEKSQLSAWRCKWMPDSPTRQSTLQTPSTVPSVCGWPWPRTRRGTCEINWAGLLTQQVSQLPSTHIGPVCQLASYSTEPWQRGTASPPRLHHACQMGWELDSNSHHGVERDWGREKSGKQRRVEMCVCGGGEKVMVFVFIYVASYYILM